MLGMHNTDPLPADASLAELLNDTKAFSDPVVECL